MQMTSGTNPKKPHGKIGLALGSGSARGWAHIGAIRALSEAGIRADYVAGTSAGALVGAVYASGNIDALEDVVLRMDWKQLVLFFDVVFPKSGLLDGGKVSDFVRSHIKETRIENLPIPFCAVSTDMITGCEVAIRDGDIIEAVRASISIPGIFTPVKKNESFLVDGGLVNPVPVSVVREMGADFVIAVNVNHDIMSKRGIAQPPPADLNEQRARTSDQHAQKKKSSIIEALNKRIGWVDFPVLSQVRRWTAKDPQPSIFEVLVASINIMEAQITAIRLKNDPPDLLFQPNLGHIRFLEFNRAEEAIAEGYREAAARLDTLFKKGPA